MISGKSAKIIKKGLLFILRDWKREGVDHTWSIPNMYKYLCIIIYDMKKKEKTID